MRQDPGRNASVIVDQITLPDTVIREQDFLWPCNLHFLPVDSNNLSAFRHFNRNPAAQFFRRPLKLHALL